MTLVDEDPKAYVERTLTPTLTRGLVELCKAKPRTGRMAELAVCKPANTRICAGAQDEKRRHKPREWADGRG